MTDNRLCFDFVIACLYRTGSHLLRELLLSTNLISFRPNDLRETPSDEEVISIFDTMGKNRVEGKQYATILRDSNCLTTIRYLELMHVDVSSVKWVWLRRGNKIAQALSDLRVSALREKYQDKVDFDLEYIDGLSLSDPPEKHKINSTEIDIDFDSLCQRTMEFSLADEAWGSFFRYHNIRPLTIFYEDFMNELGWSQTVQDILDFLEIPYTLPFTFVVNQVKQSIPKF